jgi:hypothetical protein
VSDNLIKAEDLTSDELRARATKGGIASGKARREKKAMKDTLETLLSMSLQEGHIADLNEIQSIASLNGKNVTVQEAVILKQIQKAMKGDTRSAEFLAKLNGAFVDKVELDADMELKVVVDYGD